jgi:hypothetical protein
MATVTVTRSQTFVSGDTVTPEKLNALGVPSVTATLATDEVVTAKILEGNVTAGKLAATLDLSSKTITFPETSIFTNNIADSTSTTTGVTNSKLRQSAALSVLGRANNSTGAPADIAATEDGQVLCRTGGALGFSKSPLINIVHAQTSATQTITTVIPVNAAPKGDGGATVLTAAITLSSTSSRVLIEVLVRGLTDANADNSVVGVFRSASPASSDTAIAASNTVGSAYSASGLLVRAVDAPSSAGVVTYTVKAGPGSAGNFYFNGGYGASGGYSANMMGSVGFSSITLTEIK